MPKDDNSAFFSQGITLKTGGNKIKSIYDRFMSIAYKGESPPEPTEDPFPSELHNYSMAQKFTRVNTHSKEEHTFEVEDEDENES